MGVATVYLDHNSGSHFRPVADSVRIYAPLLKFLASSFAAFLVDTVVFLLLTLFTDSLLLAVVGARAVSSAVNFLVNVVFDHGRDGQAAAAGLRYFSLVIVLLAANYGLTYALDALSVAALPAKILAKPPSWPSATRYSSGFSFRPREISHWVIPAAAPGEGAASPFALSGDSRQLGVGSGLAAHLVHIGMGLVVRVDSLRPAVGGSEVASAGA